MINKTSTHYTVVGLARPEVRYKAIPSPHLLAIFLLVNNDVVVELASR